jgi:alanine racemase
VAGYNRGIVATKSADKVSRGAAPGSWAEVSLGRLRQNFRTLQQHVGNEVTVCAVVKADAYGHGAVECSRALEAEGAKWLGVNSLSEAIPLREAGVRSRILLMTGFWRGEEDEIIRLQLTPTVWDSGQIRSLEEASAKVGGPAFPVHLKVDTGMGRLGVCLERLPEVCSALASSRHVLLEGVSTHLASSEVLDDSSVTEQLARFEQARHMLRDAGLTPALIHASNSCATIARREAWHTMVRPGLALYGYYLPFQRAGKEERSVGLEMKPILTWKTRILAVHRMASDRQLGYGGTYTTKGREDIAVLPVGYADGLNRQLSSQGRMIVRGCYAPIVGRISMDLTLVNVTGIPGVAVEDEVIVLGSSEGLTVDAQDHAQLANTIAYETLCSISHLVPRKYRS